MRIFHISLVNEKHHEEYPVVMRFVMILRIHYNACNALIKKCIAIRYGVAHINYLYWGWSMKLLLSSCSLIYQISAFDV